MVRGSSFRVSNWLKTFQFLPAEFTTILALFLYTASGFRHCFKNGGQTGSLTVHYGHTGYSTLGTHRVSPFSTVSTDTVWPTIMSKTSKTIKTVVIS